MKFSNTNQHTHSIIHRQNNYLCNPLTSKCVLLRYVIGYLLCRSCRSERPRKSNDNDILIFEVVTNFNPFRWEIFCIERYYRNRSVRWKTSIKEVQAFSKKKLWTENLKLNCAVQHSGFEIQLWQRNGERWPVGRLWQRGASLLL